MRSREQIELDIKRLWSRIYLLEEDESVLQEQIDCFENDLFNTQVAIKECRINIDDLESELRDRYEQD